MPTVHKGVVTSIGKMFKTCTVTVSRQHEVPKILKSVRRTTKYLVHDENHLTHLGDRVIISDGLKYSHRKHFRLQTIDRSGADPDQYRNKAHEWHALENKLKALQEKRDAAERKRESAEARQDDMLQRYAEQMKGRGAELLGMSDAQSGSAGSRKGQDARSDSADKPDDSSR